MRRAVLSCLLLLALCATALAQATAPDGTVLPEAGPVVLAGTAWLAQDSEGEILYEFLPGGVLRYSYNGKTFTNGTWKQNGGTVYFETNRRYAEHDGVIRGDSMDGAGRNVGGLAWKWSAVRQQASAPPPGLARLAGRYAHQWDSGEQSGIFFEFAVSGQSLSATSKSESTGSYLSSSVSNLRVAGDALYFRFNFKGGLFGLGGSQGWNFTCDLSGGVEAIPCTFIASGGSKTERGVLQRLP